MFDEFEEVTFSSSEDEIAVVTGALYSGHDGEFVSSVRAPIVMRSIGVLADEGITIIVKKM